MGELGKIGTRYARVARSSTEELSRARRIQASQIFQRQVKVLLARALNAVVVKSRQRINPERVETHLDFEI